MFGTLLSFRASDVDGFSQIGLTAYFRFISIMLIFFHSVEFGFDIWLTDDEVR